MAPQLSIVIPVHDEAASLPTLYRELVAVLPELRCEVEWIFVDDASRDESPEILRELAVGDPRVRVLSISPQAGQSAALQAGFRSAQGEIIATLDADLQNDPADLPHLLAGLDRADCVCGIRTPRRDGPIKRMASWIANGLRRRVLGDRVTDIGCSLRVMRAAQLSRVPLFRGAHRFLPVLLAMEGARVIELPVRHRARRFGYSKYGIGRRLRATGADLLGVFWLQRRTQRYEVKELNRRA